MSDSPIRRTARQHREAAGLSREKLARLADVSTSTIVRLEDGQVPGGVALARIARALEVPIEALIPADEPNGIAV